MSKLIDELGLDPEQLVWQDLALCQGIEDNEDLYDNYESDPEIAKQVDEMCLVCPVMKQCAARGAEGEWGVWGGIYWNGAGKPDKARNLHKTPEVWARIAKKIK